MSKDDQIPSFESLSRQERLAIAGLFRLMMQSDGAVSANEREHLTSFAEELGNADAFWNAVDAAARELTSADAIKSSAASITHQGLRENVYAMLLELATDESIAKTEQDLLDWLARLWNIELHDGGDTRSS